MSFVRLDELSIDGTIDTQCSFLLELLLVEAVSALNT